MKATSVYKYPGAKTNLFNWIQNNFVDHRVWVDVFGGSGVVTANKEPSKVEILNDLDNEIIHFFETLRDNRKELQEWLDQTPHSRKLQRKYWEEFNSEEAITDQIRRAGVFFYLRYTQFAAKYESFSGYNGSKNPPSSSALRSATDRLDYWQDRFKEVQFENLDFEKLIGRYDSPNTLFYCDPPYMDEGDDLYSHEGGFEHGRFVDSLLDVEGYWLVSYTRIPEPLEEAAETILSQESRVRMNQGQNEEKVNTEHLVMNYDPKEVTKFSGATQETLF